jgi:diacylglycerol O-acyltransferase
VTEARLHLGRTHLDRLTPLDASNLRVEDHGVPMHVAALVIVDGAKANNGQLQLKAIREQVERRTHLAPRLRQRLRPAPFAAGPPLWVDDPGFDIAIHVRSADLGFPADEARLLKVCAQLNEAPLDRGRPLWEMWVLTGSGDGNVALLIRIRHVLADGIAALDILGVLFDRAGVGPQPLACDDAARPMPGLRDLYADHVRAQGAALSRAVALLSRPGTAGRHLGSRLRQVRQLTRQGFAPRVSLNQPVGRHRTMRLVRADLAGARATAHAHGAKVNDVVLAAMAGGARALLDSRGELVADLRLRVSVAASLPGPRDEVTGGNRVGVRLVPLPVGEPSAIAALQDIAAVTRPARDDPPYQPGGRFMQRWMVRAMFHQRLVNLLLSNLPGPATPMYFAGARVLELFQIGLVQGNITLSVGVLSYDGQLNFDIVADADAIADVAVFADGLSAALAELGALARQVHPLSSTGGRPQSTEKSAPASRTRRMPG